MKRTSLLILITFSLTVIVLAQSGRVRKKPDPEDDRLRLRAEEVLLPVSVRTDRGALPLYLDKSDLLIVEDGKRQEILSIQKTPANILFILDTSGEATTLKEINLHRTFAGRMIDEMAADDRAAIITYSEKVKLLVGWTEDKKALQSALQESFRPGLKSSLYESLLFAAREVLPGAGARRSVVLVTDGIDSFNPLLLQTAVTELTRARATLYIVFQNEMLLAELRPMVFNKLSRFQMIDPQTRKKFERLRLYARRLESAEVILEQIAEDSGGTIWNPIKRDELEQPAPLARQVLKEIGMEFVVAYASPRRESDDSLRKIRVYSNRRDLIVRSRKNVYSASPEKSSLVEGQRFLP